MPFRSSLFVRGTALAFVVAAALDAPSARAQNAGNQAEAEALFDQGKAAMAAQNYPEACPKFFESNRLDEGIGTSLWLAECYEKNGQTASAWAQFREAASLAVKEGDPREKVARERAQTLEKKLARLVVIVPTASRIAGLHVARDGAAVGTPLWGTSVPVDPGHHTLVVSAEEHRPTTLSIDVLPGPGEQALIVPVLADAPPPPPPPPAPVVADVVATALPMIAGLPMQRVEAIASGAVGVVSLVVASYFGLHAKAKLDDSNADGHCMAKNLCDATGVADRSSAESAATLSTVFFVVTGAALAGGGVLWFTAPKPPPMASSSARLFVPSAPRLVPWASPRGAGVVLGAEF
jgi:hypothetical protein